MALCAAAAVALVLGIVIGGGSSNDDEAPGPDADRTPAGTDSERSAERPAVDRLSLRQQVGQLVISSFDETTRPDYIRRRLTAGETAGVILFGRNGGDAAQWRRLTRSIQDATSGRALVMVDQEGGDIRTVAYAGPAAGQASQGGPEEVEAAAREAARQLSEAGVNVNLAPVADVAERGGVPSVMDGRAFAGGPDEVAAATRASIRGMRAAGVAATAKHFPGLGGSQINTDDAPATVEGEIDADLVPFEAAIAERVPLMMLSHASYPALDPDAIASQSKAIATGLLARPARLPGRGRDRQHGGAGGARRLRRRRGCRASRPRGRRPRAVDRLGKLERGLPAPARGGAGGSGAPGARPRERGARPLPKALAPRLTHARARAPSAHGGPSACPRCAAPMSRPAGAPTRTCRRRSSA